MEFGKLNFTLRIALPHNEHYRSKQVNLYSVYCPYDEVPEEMAKFKKLNPDLRDVHVTWVFTQHFSMDSL